MASNAENVPIWWRRHVVSQQLFMLSCSTYPKNVNKIRSYVFRNVANTHTHISQIKNTIARNPPNFTNWFLYCVRPVLKMSRKSGNTSFYNVTNTHTSPTNHQTPATTPTLLPTTPPPRRPRNKTKIKTRYWNSDSDHRQNFANFISIISDLCCKFYYNSFQWNSFP